MITAESNNLENWYVNQAFQEGKSLYELPSTYKTDEYNRVTQTTYLIREVRCHHIWLSYVF